MSLTAALNTETCRHMPQAKCIGNQREAASVCRLYSALFRYVPSWTQPCKEEQNSRGATIGEGVLAGNCWLKGALPIDAMKLVPPCVDVVLGTGATTAGSCGQRIAARQKKKGHRSN